MAQEAPTAPWHASFPAPQHTAPLLTRDAALPALGSGQLLLVDVRRTDYEGGTIKGSLNLPAHSFYLNRAALYDLCTRAGIKDVAFYCDVVTDPIPDICSPHAKASPLGSSNGRGPRCSGWFADFISEKGGESSIRALTLDGGIKGWVNAGGKFVESMEGFEPEYWKQFAQDGATC
ncbi:uncharacterized protein BDZ99DRAFT_479184 [Mytilinidion resinicola]|uniref:Rhodanese domain-containing protein n=1 Tax=Mytilinidion resinicola TaxID=574789 RepID=A0A6A6YD87_9PEZI|nr:uncharacterized protein BDZ99DRAFT_479184 [Mytilinidion resinicola]KAF2806791.1 hypothetical protein BDZ99DRAFT_479184 [Mytilinidion resinicola]